MRNLTKFAVMVALFTVSNVLARPFTEPVPKHVSVAFVGDEKHGRIYPGERVGDDKAFIKYKSNGNLVGKLVNSDTGNLTRFFSSNTAGSCPGYAMVHPIYGLAVIDCNNFIIWKLDISYFNSPGIDDSDRYPYTNFMLEVKNVHEPDGDPLGAHDYGTIRLFDLDNSKLAWEITSNPPMINFWSPDAAPQLLDSEVHRLWTLAGFDDAEDIAGVDLDNFQNDHEEKPQSLTHRVYSHWKDIRPTLEFIFPNLQSVDDSVTLANRTVEKAHNNFCNAYFIDPDDCQVYGDFDSIKDRVYADGHERFCKSIIVNSDTCELYTVETAEEAFKDAVLAHTSDVTGALMIMATFSKMDELVASDEFRPEVLYDSMMSSILQVPTDELPVYDSLAEIFNSNLSSDNGRYLNETEGNKFWFDGGVARMLGRNPNIQYDITGAEITFSFEDLFGAIWREYDSLSAVSLPGFSLLQVKAFLTWPKYDPDPDKNVSNYELRIRLADIAGLHFGGRFGQVLRRVTLDPELDMVGAHEWRWLFEKNLDTSENTFKGHRYNPSVNAVAVVNFSIGDLLNKIIKSDWEINQSDGWSDVGVAPDTALDINDFAHTEPSQILHTNLAGETEVLIENEIELGTVAREGLSMEELRSMAKSYNDLSYDGKNLFDILALDHADEYGGSNSSGGLTRISDVLSENEQGNWQYRPTDNSQSPIDFIGLREREKQVLQYAEVREDSVPKTLATLLHEGPEYVFDLTGMEAAKIAKTTNLIKVLGAMSSLVGGNEIGAIGCGVGTEYKFDALNHIYTNEEERIAKRRQMKRSIYIPELVFASVMDVVGTALVLKGAEASPTIAKFVADKFTALGHSVGIASGFFLGDLVARSLIERDFDNPEMLFESSWACFVFGEYKPWGDQKILPSLSTSGSWGIPVNIGLVGAVDARFNYMFAGSSVDITPSPHGRERSGNRPEKIQAELADTNQNIREHSEASGGKYIQWIRPGHIEWWVDAPAAGEYDIEFGYAAGSGRRSNNLFVNTRDYTNPTRTVWFEYTGAWDTYSVKTVKVKFNQGRNLIALSKNLSEGTHIDYLRIEQDRSMRELVPIAATQVNTYQGNEAVAGAHLAIDGITDGEWGGVTSTNTADNNWWQMDFGERKEVTSVVVYNRVGCCPHRLDDFYILVSDQNITGLTLAEARTRANFEVFESSVIPSETGNNRRGYDLPSGVYGRYVQIYKPGNEWLSLAEVTAYGMSYRGHGLSSYNLEFQDASQRSTSYGGDASRAIDGNTDGNYANQSVTHTRGNSTVWWQGDLGGSRVVESVTLYGRSDCCTERLDDYYILVSDQPFQGMTADQARGNANTVVYESTPVPVTDRSNSKTIELPEGAVGRYVAVLKDDSSNGALSLAEVKATGWDPNLQKLVFNTAVQKDTAHGGVATKAIDGNTDGNHYNSSVSHTASYTNVWWQGDLGASKSLESVVLYNRTDALPQRLDDFYILISEQPIAGMTLSQARSIADVEVYESEPLPGAVLNNSRQYYLPKGTKGRYVSVYKAEEFLSLAEVEVFGDAGPSKQLGFQATSQFDTLGGFVSDLAADGVTGGDFKTEPGAHSQSWQNAWWQGDLGTAKAVEKVTVYNRTDCCSSRLDDFYVFVTDQPMNGLTLEQARNAANAEVYETSPVPGGPGANQVTFEIPGSARGRYVVVYLPFDYLQLAEVVVTGRE